MGITASYNPFTHSLCVSFQTVKIVFKVLSFTKVWTFVLALNVNLPQVTNELGCVCVRVCVCVFAPGKVTSLKAMLFLFPESAVSHQKNNERVSKCMHICVGLYCDSGNDEWAAHFNQPTLPRWWGSLRDTGQSLITLPVRVSQPHLHKPDTNQMHLMLFFTRHHISSLT